MNYKYLLLLKLDQGGGQLVKTWFLFDTSDLAKKKLEDAKLSLMANERILESAILRVEVVA